MSASRPIALGIVGAGWLAEHVLFDVLARMPAVRVSAVADPSEARRAVARRWFPGARITADTQALLAGAAPEAVVICCPPAVHADAALRAIDAGVHVYLEKPLAVDLEQGRRLAERARASGRVAMIGLNYRHHPLVERLRGAIAAGRIGRPVAMHSVFSVAGGGSGWRASPASGGGALFELGSHHFDLVRFLFGAEIVQVSARIWSRRHEGDSAIAGVELETGVHGSLALMIGAADEDHVFVLGDRGSARLDRLSGRMTFGAKTFEYGRRHALGRAAREAGAAVAGAASRPGEPSYARALSAFVHAIRTGRPAPPCFEDGLRSLEAVDAAGRSARCGTPVALGVGAAGAGAR